MASISLPTSAQLKKLRPLNILKDLPAVADLIELCFSETMDNEGKRYVQDMRRASDDNSFIKWANRVADSTSLPLTGYIWEEDNQIVGNISLVPFRHRAKKLYLIANVAVHPNYRRRGIAYALTERALLHARSKKIKDVWLHVRADNPEAILLYSKLGFKERARRVSYQSIAGHYEIKQQDYQVGKRYNHFWQTQRLWLLRFYPDLLAWYQNWNFSLLRPGLLNWLYLFLTDTAIQQWVVTKGEQLHSTLAFIPHERGESLFLGIGERSAPEAVTAILIQARKDLLHYRPKLKLEFPISNFDSAIQAAGFKQVRTLIWMHATL